MKTIQKSWRAAAVALGLGAVSLMSGCAVAPFNTTNTGADIFKSSDGTVATTVVLAPVGRLVAGQPSKVDIVAKPSEGLASALRVWINPDNSGDVSGYVESGRTFRAHIVDGKITYFETRAGGLSPEIFQANIPNNAYARNALEAKYPGMMANMQAMYKLAVQSAQAKYATVTSPTYNQVQTSVICGRDSASVATYGPHPGEISRSEVRGDTVTLYINQVVVQAHGNFRQRYGQDLTFAVIDDPFIDPVTVTGADGTVVQSYRQAGLLGGENSTRGGVRSQQHIASADIDFYRNKARDDVKAAFRNGCIGRYGGMPAGPSFSFLPSFPVQLNPTLLMPGGPQ